MRLHGPAEVMSGVFTINGKYERRGERSYSNSHRPVHSPRSPRLISTSFPSLSLTQIMPAMPVRRPSASTNHPIPSNVVRQHRSTESHHGFTTMSTQPSSFYSSNTSPAASHQQKIIHILVNRLKNKVLSPPSLSYLLRAHYLQLPSNSGADLTQVETDPAVVETVQCLVELSKDSLDIIGLALTEVLDKLAKVRSHLFCPPLSLSFCSYYSKQMRTAFGRSMSFSPSCLSSKSFL